MTRDKGHMIYYYGHMTLNYASHDISLKCVCVYVDYEELVKLLQISLVFIMHYKYYVDSK